jgi:hypothetical protein
MENRNYRKRRGAQPGKKRGRVMDKELIDPQVAFAGVQETPKNSAHMPDNFVTLTQPEYPIAPTVPSIHAPGSTAPKQWDAPLVSDGPKKSIFSR